MKKGSSRCTGCNNTITQYRKFNSPEEPTDTTATIKQLQAQQQASDANNDKKSTVAYAQESMSEIDTSPQAPIATGVGAEAAASTTATTAAQWGFISIQSLVGMTAYDSEAYVSGQGFRNWTTQVAKRKHGY